MIPEDLFALAEDVMLHRMRLTYEALADGKTGMDVLKKLLREIGGAARPTANGHDGRAAHAPRGASQHR